MVLGFMRALTAVLTARMGNLFLARLVYSVVSLLIHPPSIVLERFAQFSVSGTEKLTLFDPLIPRPSRPWLPPELCVPFNRMTRLLLIVIMGPMPSSAFMVLVVVDR